MSSWPARKAGRRGRCGRRWNAGRSGAGHHPHRARGAVPRTHPQCAVTAARGQRDRRSLRGRLPLARAAPDRRDRRRRHPPDATSLRRRPPPRRAPLDAGVQNPPLHLAAGCLRATFRSEGNSDRDRGVASRPMDAEITLTINGTEHRLTVDTRTTLLDAAARAPRPDRRQEGLRPRPVRRVHGAARRPPGQQPAWRSRSPTTAPRSPRSRASPTATSCTRCSRPSSTTTPSSAATARPGQLCSAVGMLDEARPAAQRVTADLSACPSSTTTRSASA